MKKLSVIFILICSLFIIQTADSSVILMGNKYGPKFNPDSVKSEIINWFEKNPQYNFDLSNLEFYGKFDFDKKEYEGKEFEFKVTVPNIAGTWKADDPISFMAIKAGPKYALYWYDPEVYEHVWGTAHLRVGNGQYPDVSSVILFTTSPVPIPGAAWLLASGLLGMLAIRRRFISNK